jgi:hypothetical protein
MTNPYDGQPYAAPPTFDDQPPIFTSTRQRIIWTALPVLSCSLLSFLPFVVFAVKGFVKPTIAGAYVIAEVFVLSAVMAIPESQNQWAGLLEILLMLTAATHTALLDNQLVKFSRK